MEKVFDYQKLEPEIYQKWQESGVFHATIDDSKTPFTIIMPPPNVNGVLHAGHALEVSLQDLMTRIHRMKGYSALWLPGVDHAGIATQIAFEKKLADEDKTRFDLGREEFVNQTMKFSLDNRGTIEGQIKSLGGGPDWDRKRFTLDPEANKAVTTTFIKLFNDGLIYKGERIINWCQRCETGVSDLEVEHKESEGQLVYIKYPFVDGSGSIVVATTRPETMLGDTAVAVNPEDSRYKDLIGKMIALPIVNREIPIIGDDVVDPEFGTGAVKVTPAHSQVDFEIGERHDLDRISVIGKNGKMLEDAGEFADKKVNETRSLVIERLQELGLIEKIDKYTHAVSRCERCNSVIEPLLSEQWFVKTRPLADKAIAAVKDGRIKIQPERFEKVYFDWMENIRDWNISRQLWWGHQIPVYYSKSDNFKWTVAQSEAEAREMLGEDVIQDQDTLDTWFSSGLWPLATLGWPEDTQEVEYFYPTSVMAPGRDILFFWVARMIMLGLYLKPEQVPFKVVSLHGLVNDKFGKKMSKSKNNGVDPIELVRNYGADALRFTLLVNNVPGADQSLSEDQVRGNRNFANKIWNVARFIEMTLEGEEASDYLAEYSDTNTADFVQLWETTKNNVNDLISKGRFDLAADNLYHFVWDELADKYLEYSKDRSGDIEIRQTLKAVLREVLIMLHPFIPFVTEAIWGEMFADKGMLAVQEWVNN